MTVEVSHIAPAVLFLCYSGVVAWLVLGVIGALYLGERLADWALQSLGAQSDFVKFLRDRQRERGAKL